MSFMGLARRQVVTTLSGALGLAVTLSAQQTPFISRSDLVVVPAVVVDGGGQPILGLTQDDFEVREDGKPVELTTFVGPDIAAASGGVDGRYIVLVLDNLRIDPTRAWKVKDIARKFAVLMGGQDVVSVIKLNGDRTVTTNRKSDVLASIDRFAPSPLAGENFRPFALDGEQALRTIAELSRQLANVPHRRKVLVVVGEALLFSPLLPGGGYSAPWFDAIRETGQNNVSVYVMDPAGLTGDGGRYDGARSFAGETGGDALVNTNNVDRAVSRIWMEAGTYYLLGYAPPIDDKRVHKIEVTVKRPGTQVRARKARG